MWNTYLGSPRSRCQNGIARESLVEEMVQKKKGGELEKAGRAFRAQYRSDLGKGKRSGKSEDQVESCHCSTVPRKAHSGS